MPHVRCKMALFARGTSVFIVSNRTYSMLIVPSVKSKTWNNLPSKFAIFGHSIFNVRFTNSGSPENKKKQFVLFDDLFKQKRDEARRSIVVQVNAQDGWEELYSYCSTFGIVNSIFCCKTNPDKTQQILVEFKNVETVDKILKLTAHKKLKTLIPVHSSFLYFRKESKSKVSNSSNINVLVKHEKINLSENVLLEEIRKSNTVSRQIQKCYSMLKLDDLGLRLRFQMAHQLECSLSGLFPEIEALPFGSSVNGFGKIDCDLDLNINFQRKRTDKRSKFFFQSKYFENERDIKATYVRTIGDLINIFVPGVRNVVKIGHAHVPIIKFDHHITGIECDISFSNMTSLYMSELLYIYGEIDSRVKPLIFTIRMWARIQDITKDSPGGYITNFILTLMIIFYLQQKKVLPNVNELNKKARSKDLRITDAFVDCTFLRDVSNIQKLPPYSESSFSLLQEFFKYYAVFNFKQHAICLREGTNMTYKMKNSPIYIHNPFEKFVNVSRNVSDKELEKFVSKCRDAALTLENAPEKPKNDKSWGILQIFEESDKKPLNLAKIMV